MALTAVDMVNAAQDLSLPELEAVIAQLVAVHARRAVEAGHLDEADLVRMIVEAIPPALHRRYDQLKARRRAGRLSEAEHEEFGRLIELVEELDARRPRYLVQLARSRGTTLEHTMADLGLKPPPIA